MDRLMNGMLVLVCELLIPYIQSFSLKFKVLLSAKIIRSLLCGIFYLYVIIIIIIYL